MSCNKDFTRFDASFLPYLRAAWGTAVRMEPTPHLGQSYNKQPDVDADYIGRRGRHYCGDVKVVCSLSSSGEHGQVGRWPGVGRALRLLARGGAAAARRRGTAAASAPRASRRAPLASRRLRHSPASSRAERRFRGGRGGGLLREPWRRRHTAAAAGSGGGGGSEVAPRSASVREGVGRRSAPVRLSLPRHRRRWRAAR